MLDVTSITEFRAGGFVTVFRVTMEGRFIEVEIGG